MMLKSLWSFVTLTKFVGAIGTMTVEVVTNFVSVDTIDVVQTATLVVFAPGIPAVEVHLVAQVPAVVLEVALPLQRHTVAIATLELLRQVAS